MCFNIRLNGLGLLVYNSTVYNKKCVIVIIGHNIIVGLEDHSYIYIYELYLYDLEMR